MNNLAVSVIIPVRNAGKYFKKCLNSVVSQSLKNIEIIIIDDNSTDGSNVVADKYASQDSRILVIHQKSSTGAGFARNRAMSIARGEFIAFMDSDDIYPSNDVLETLYSQAVEQNANICGGSLYKIDAEGKILNMNIPNQYFLNSGWYNYCDYQYDGGFYRFLYKNKFLKENCIIFPLYKRFQDPVFFVKAMISAGKFYVVKKYCYAYRKNHKKIFWNDENINGQLNGIYDIIKIAKKNKYNNLKKLMKKNLIKTIKNVILKNKNIKKIHYTPQIIKIFISYYLF